MVGLTRILPSHNHTSEATSTLDVDLDVSMTLAAARAEKDKRNARDRRLRERKRQKLDQMRALLSRLEQEKQYLEAVHPLMDPMSPLDPTMSVYDKKIGASETQQQYWQVLEQIEELRLENRVLSHRLAERELEANAVETLLQHEHTRIHKDAALFDQAQLPLSSDEVHNIADTLHAQLAPVLERVRTMNRFTQVEFNGWSDLRCSIEARMEFAVRKVFEHETAASLCAKTWELFTSATMIKQMSPLLAKGEPNVNFFGPDVALTWCYDVGSSIFGNSAVFTQSKTQGRYCVGLAAFNHATVVDDLAAGIPLAQPGYWLFEDLPADDEHPARVLVQFGGSIASGNEAALPWVISELVFTVVRWELVGIRPPMLTWK